jgi:hypothetical protein
MNAGSVWEKHIVQEKRWGTKTPIADVQVSVYQQRHSLLGSVVVNVRSLQDSTFSHF